MTWPIVMRGDSEPNGSWNTSCNSRRSGRIASRSSGAISRAVEADDALARQKAQQRAPERRLAGTGFADDADGLALLQRQRDVVDGAQQHRLALQEPAADLERHLDVAPFQQHRRGLRAAQPCGRSARLPAASWCSRACGAVKSASVAPSSTISPCRMT